MIPTLNPYLRHGAQAVTPRGATLPDQTGYVVVYIYQAQGTVFPPFDAFYGRAEPLHVVTIHGVDYAWIYEAAPAVPQPRPARFGEHIRLRGFAQQGEVPRGAPATLTLFWEVGGSPPLDYWLFARVLGPDGRPYVQLDVPYPTSTWSQRRYHTTELPLALPPDAPPGTYRVVIGLYDPASGERLPLDAASTADPAQSGPHALLLTRFEVGE
jgi:hypothetical protein